MLKKNYAVLSNLTQSWAIRNFLLIPLLLIRFGIVLANMIIKKVKKNRKKLPGVKIKNLVLF